MHEFFEYKYESNISSNNYQIITMKYQQLLVLSTSLSSILAAPTQNNEVVKLDKARVKNVINKVAADPNSPVNEEEVKSLIVDTIKQNPQILQLLLLTEQKMVELKYELGTVEQDGERAGVLVEAANFPWILSVHVT